MAIVDRVRQAWNAFRNVAPENVSVGYGGEVSYGGSSPTQTRLRFTNERSIISSIYTRISIDVSGVSFHHIKLDDKGRYEDDINSNLNSCLTFEPNKDQGPRAFRQNIVTTLFDKGCAVIVPIDTSVDPNSKEILDIYTMRIGEVVKWLPNHVRVSVYNEAVGRRQEITIEKRLVAIIENPLYNVINEPNSTFQRLIRKLNLLDVVDDQSSSGKLDIIIQLPYAIKTEARKLQAEKRRDDIEFQLKGSQYGIAYSDATEKITQLNRPAENNLLKQVEYLTNMLYDQLGITTTVMDGTADESTMRNYYNRTVEPIADAIMEAMQRSFIGRARSVLEKERIQYFIDAFKLVPISQIAEIADKLTRNEVLSSNDIRGIIGFKPVRDDPNADLLRNSNMPQPPTGTVA